MTTTTFEASAAGTATQHHTANPPAFWGGVFAMTLCVFALIASEFMPVSLLTPIAADLHVTEGMAGQGIAISGAFAVLTSLSISLLAGTLNRKTLLLALTGLMAISGAVVALAPNYLIYMVGRALLGVVIGGFWSMSAATAMRLVPSDQVPKALAIFNGGNALATVVAAPLGSYLGSVVGWRGAFLCLVPVAADHPGLAMGQSARHDGRATRTGSGHVLALLKRREVALGMAGCGAFFMGQFALFTYLRPFLETVTLVRRLNAVADAAGHRHGRLHRHDGHRHVPDARRLPAPDRHSDRDGGDRRGADRLRHLGRRRHRAPRPVGAAVDRGAGGLVELDRSSHAQERRGRRGADGGRDPVGHRDGLDGRGHAVRCQRLPEHLRGKRGGAAAGRLSHASDVTRRHVAGRLSRARSRSNAVTINTFDSCGRDRRPCRGDQPSPHPAPAGDARAVPAPVPAHARRLRGRSVGRLCARPRHVQDAASPSARPEEPRMWMTVGEHRFAITLADTAAARAFSALLPLTLDMGD